MIVGVAGAIGSGKTRLSAAIADRFGWARAAFGDHVRAVARERGEPETREHLQALGEALIARGWTPFCEAVLARVPWAPGKPLIVDGIRHVEALDTLRTVCAPDAVALVYVTAAPEVRRARLARRDRVSAKDVERFEAHNSEGQAEQLRARASLVLDGHGDVDRLVDEVAAWKKGVRERG